MLTIPSNILAQAKNAAIRVADSSVIVFNDDNYKLALHVFSLTDDYGIAMPNATLTLKYFNGKDVKTLLVDSLICMKPWIRFEDFNNDGVKDILVFNTTSARSNWTHYLYVVDSKSKSIHRVKGFEKLLNPHLDCGTNIISSIALYGKTYYSFYRIKKNSLDSLGYGFETDAADAENKYKKAIKQIIKKDKELQ